MIIVNSIANMDGNVRTVRASLFADDKSDVVPGAEIIGLPRDYQLEMGSDVVTAKGERAYYTSYGTWTWVSSGGGGGGTNDYNDLINKPKINGVELSGDVAPADLDVGVTYNVDPADDTLVIS